MNNVLLEDLENALGTNGVNIVTNNGFVSYTEEDGWDGTFNTLDLSKMYKIEGGTACNIVLEGNVVDPADYIITLKHGINWIGFPVSYSMSLSEAFSGFTPTVGDIVKSFNEGQAQYTNNGWTGALRNLEPGQGYLYISKSTSTQTFTYPSAE